MTLYNWILLGLAVISTGLYIFSLIKRFKLLRKISACFIFPLSAAILISNLFDYLPDSRHILIVSIVAAGLTSIVIILNTFDRIRTIKLTLRFIFIFMILAWMELYKSTYFIYRIPTWFYIVSSIFYLLIAIIGCILCGKQSIHIYVNAFVSMVFGFILNFTTSIMLCYNPCLQTILLFSGVTLTTSLIIFHILDNVRFHFKYYRQISLLLITISQGLILFSNILMIK